MKNLITTIKFIAKASLFVFAFSLFSHNAFAAAEINEVNNQSMCKSVADISINGYGFFGSQQQFSANAGDTIAVRALASNTGDTSTNVSFSVNPSVGSNSVTFNVGVNGGSYSKTVALPANSTLTPLGTKLTQRTGPQQFDNGQNPYIVISNGSIVTSALSVDAANFNSSNGWYLCYYTQWNPFTMANNQFYNPNANPSSQNFSQSAYGGFSRQGNPVTHFYEKGYVWYYEVSTPVQNPPVVSNINPSGTIQNMSGLTWSANNNATSCQVDYYNGGTAWDATVSYPASPYTAAATTPGTYTGQIRCTNAGGYGPWEQFSYTIQQIQITPITVDLKVNNANSATLTSGQLALLTWSSTGPVNACTGNFTNPAGQVPLPGSNNNGVVKNPTVSGTYQINCTGVSGQTATDSVTVTVNAVQNTPTLATTFSVTGSNGQTQTSPNTTPITITQGQSATLSYSVLAQNGGSGSSLNCQVPVSTGGGWNSPITSNTGGVVTQPLGVQNTVGTKTYSLNCTFSGITSNRNVTVIVNQAAATPIGIDLRVNGQNGPLSVTPGTPLVLNWNPVAGSGPIGSNACTLSWAAGSYGGTGSTPSFGAVSTQTYTVTCTAAGVPNAVDSVTVNVASAPTPSVTLVSVSPNPATPGSSVFISYNSQNTTACQLYVKVPGATSFYPVGASNLPTTGTTSFVIPATPTTGVYTFKVICNGASSGTQPINVQPSNGNPVITIGLSAAGSNGQTAVSPNTLTINQGQTVTLTYYVNGTGGSAGSNPICTASVVGGGYWTYGINSNTSASSVALGAQNTIGSKTYKLDCTYSGITATPKQVTVNVVSNTAASVNATANPTSVVLGNTSTISWNGTGVNLSNCFVQKRTAIFTWNTIISNVSSGQQVTPSNGTNTYRVGCYATSNGAVVYSNNVSVGTTTSSNLGVTLTANGQAPSTTITSGQQVALAWNVTGSSYPTCTRSWISGTVNSTSGSSYVYPTQTTTYTITCQSTSTSNGGYPVSDTVTVYVNGNGNQLDVTTGTYNNVTDSSVRLYGDLNNDGTGNVTEWFEVSTSSNPTCNYSSIENLVQTSVNGTGSFDKIIYSLNDNTTYYYRACAKDSSGVTDSGVIYNFTTDSSGSTGDFSITTLSPDNVDSDSATLRGSVDNEDNVDVWFVYSTSDSTPECNGNDTEAYVSGTYDDGQDFDKSTYSLQSNRTYYYRACGEKNGVVEYGNVRTFSTDNNYNPDPIDPPTPPNNGNGLPIITTLFPGSIGADSANLQATVNANGCSATTWFKYSTGPGSIQPQQTSPVVQGNVSGVVTDSISSLLPGITYYVTAYAQNCRGTVSGGTVAFKTVGPIPTDYDTATYTYTPTAVVQYIGGGTGADWLKLDIDDSSTTTTVGQTSQYKVTWENLTNSTLKSGKISVIFPKQLQVLATSQGQITSDGSVINVVGDIQGNKTTTGTYKGEFVVTTRARSIAAGTAVVAQAIAAFDTPKSDAQVNAIDYDENQVLNNGLFGAAAFGTGPFGLGPMGWILLLLGILLIFLIARYAAMSRTGYAPQMMHYPPQQLYYQQPPQPMYTQPMYTQPVMQQPVYQAPVAPMATSRPAVEPISSLPTEDTVDEYEYKPYRPTYPQE